MENYKYVTIVVRLTSVLLVQSSFVADEYWQALEVAHRLAFGYGYQTWEWKEGIRSYLLPLIIAAVYKILHFLHLDNRETLVYLPRLLTALLSAAGDLSVVDASRRLFGPRAARHTAFSLASSWCLFYCGSRTLANTVETALLALALRWYPWQTLNVDAGHRYLYLGAVATVLRPTAALVWLPLWIADLCSSRSRRSLLTVTAAVGVFALLVSFAVDSLGHGAPLLSALQFLRVNVLGGVASHYGTSPWHEHLTVSLPTLLTVHLLAVLPALRRPDRHQTLCLAAVAWLFAVYSALPHKEFRFLLPIWPFCALLAGRGLLALNRASPRWCTLLKTLILLVNVPAALYLGLVHQQGPLDVSARLAARLDAVPLQNVSVLYLMPCHSTPLYSHLHLNVKTRFLTCEPNLAAEAHYVDEADIFYQNPERWLRQMYPGLVIPRETNSTDAWRNGAKRIDASEAIVTAPGASGETSSVEHQTDVREASLPSHIVLFDTLWAELGSSIAGYSVCEDVFHAHFYEARRGGRLLVLCRSVS